MTDLVKAKCPNCGSILLMKANLDRAICVHCGRKVIISKDIHYRKGKPSVTCPECEGKGYKICDGEVKMVKPPYKMSFFKEWFFSTDQVAYYVYPCCGTGKCTLTYVTVDGPFTEPPYGKKIVKDLDYSSSCENGKCRNCHGTGIAKSLILKKMKECYVCKQRKICFVCKGTGKCTFCNGTGRMTCTTCNGSGYKVYRAD